jgi:hypothetical protein
MARIIIPHLNPLQFYKELPDVSARFNTRDFDDWYFSDTILPWQQKVHWCQPWQLSDNLKLQLQSTISPVNLLLFNYEGGLVDTIPFNQMQQSENDPELFIYQIDVDMSGYPQTSYYFQIQFGSNPVVLTLQSENINLSEKIENTILLEYTNPTFIGEMIFETGIQPSVRIPAVKKYKGPASKNTIFEDQVMDQSLVRSVNYRIWTLSIGGSKGIPDYFADNIDRYLSCKTVLIDGKYYTKVDASIEPNEVDNYPMRGWKIDMRERNNAGSRLYENNEAQNTKVAVMVNVDSKGFGADTGGNETAISNVI